MRWFNPMGEAGGPEHLESESRWEIGWIGLDVGTCPLDVAMDLGADFQLQTSSVESERGVTTSRARAFVVRIPGRKENELMVPAESETNASSP